MGKMGRRPWYDKNGMKKGAWSQEEDDKLRSYIEKYGHQNWRQLPKFARLRRCGKSCRFGWLNYLRRNIKRGNFSKEEEDLIMLLRAKHGNKWADIATRLPGRTENEVKNYWHSKLKKRLKDHHQSSNQVGLCSNISPFNANTEVPQPIEFSKFVHNQEKDLVINPTKISFPSTSGSHSQFSESSSNGLSLEFDYEFLDDLPWYGVESINSFKSYYKPTENFWTSSFIHRKIQDDLSFSTLDAVLTVSHNL